MMTQAIRENHLGDNHKELYPILTAFLDRKEFAENDAEEIENVVSKMKEQCKSIAQVARTVESKQKEVLQEQLLRLGIEICCLMLLNPDLKPPQRMNILGELLAKSDKLEFKNDVTGIIREVEPAKASPVKWVKVHDSDSWEDMLLMGDEVSNSCQRISGDPYYNKCLLAYIGDGKNKLMIVRDIQGRIAARSVLRILLDEKGSPVLFMERLYTKKSDPKLAELILQGCLSKAKIMGLPLVASIKDYPELAKNAVYPGALKALGGPAPYEYVDALGGIQKDGQFSIPEDESRILGVSSATSTLSRLN